MAGHCQRSSSQCVWVQLTRSSSSSSLSLSLPSELSGGPDELIEGAGPAALDEIEEPPLVPSFSLPVETSTVPEGWELIGWLCDTSVWTAATVGVAVTVAVTVTVTVLVYDSYQYTV